MRVSEVMTRDVEMVPPDLPVTNAAAIMRRLNVGFLPVVDNDQIVGVLTDRDIVIRCIADGMDPNQCQTGQIMSQQVISCSENTSVEQAAKMMESRKVRRLVVTDEEGRCVGVCSLGDLVVDSGDEKLAGEVLHEVSQPVRSR